MSDERTLRQAARLARQTARATNAVVFVPEAGAVHLWNDCYWFETPLPAGAAPEAIKRYTQAARGVEVVVRIRQDKLVLIEGVL